MLMVICGAGASRDSIASLRHASESEYLWRPPVTQEIFGRSNFLAVAEELGIEADDIQRFQASDSIEAALQELCDLNTQGSVKQVMAIRWFLQIIFAQCGELWPNPTDKLNYEILIDKIEANATCSFPVCFVTFNYDLLLERAFSRGKNPIRFDSLDAHWNQTRYALFKPHGSVNWSRQITSPLFEGYSSADQLALAKEVIRRASEIRGFTSLYNLQTEYASSLKRPIAWNEPMTNAMIPALAIPVVRKADDGRDGFVCPPEHIPKLRAYAEAATKVLLIGSRAREDHFFRLLPKDMNSFQVGIICRSRDEATDVACALSNTHGIRAKFTAMSGGFSDSLDGDEVDEFLST